MKVVAVTFGGRKCSLEILFSYILKYKEYIDEYKIFVATTIESDILYMEEFARNNSNFVKLEYVYDENNNRITGNTLIWDYAYNICQDDDSVYIKFDDDIVYFDETLFTDFLKYRIDNPDIPMLFPVIINNEIISWILEQEGIYSPKQKSYIGNTWPNTYKRIQPAILANIGKQIKIGQFTRTSEVLCPMAWGNLEYCVDLHNQFIHDLKNNNVDKYKMKNKILEHKEPVSISCCSWLGKSLNNYIKTVGKVLEDEPWWCVFLPTWINKNNEIYGNCVVSHYAYYRQRELGLDNTNILKQYKDLAFGNSINKPLKNKDLAICNRINKLSLKNLDFYIKKTCECCFVNKAVNLDMLWKQHIMIKFIEENNIHPKSILDIGAGEMGISGYLISKYDCEYIGVDLGKGTAQTFINFLTSNKISTDKVKYYEMDFLTYIPIKKHDIIIDVCSMIHFNPNKNICHNDGLFMCGEIVYNSLTDDGLFLFTSDCLNRLLPNHYNVLNREYIEPEQIIECFEKANLQYLPEHSQFLTREDVNASHSEINLNVVSAGWNKFDWAHVDAYDRVFLVFKKNTIYR
jgi:hypothetical protein